MKFYRKLMALLPALLILWLTSCNAPEAKSNNKAGKAQTEQTSKQIVAVSLDNAEWLAKQQEEPGIIIDVRTPGEWQEGYIEGAQFADFFDDNFVDKLTAAAPDKNQPVYVYCRSGNRSKKTMAILKEKGYTRIYELDNGYMGWVDEGNPVKK